MSDARDDAITGAAWAALHDDPTVFDVALFISARAALRALPPGVVLVAGVPDEREASRLIGGSDWLDGHNACRADILRRVVEVRE